MSYLLNSGFSLEYRVFPNKEKVYFISFQNNTGKIFILDDISIRLVENLMQFGSINTNEPTELKALKRLEFEGIVFCADDKRKSDESEISIENLQFWIQTTDRCNLACTYCYIPSLNSTKPRNINLFSLLGKKLLELKDRGLKNVSIKLAGGEPLLCFNEWADEVIELKQFLKNNEINLSIRIISNLTVLNKKIIDYVKQYDMSMSVSLDGLGQYHDKNRLFSKRNKSSFDIIKKNLDLLREHGIKPSVLVTTTSENQSGISEFIKYIVDEDLAFRISDAKGGHIKSDEFKLTFQNTKAVLSESMKSGYPISKRIVVSDLKTLSPRAEPCSMGVSAAAIYLDGSVYFCHTEFETGKPLGFLDETDDLISIIQRGYIKQLGLSKDCQSCEFRIVCAGGCPLYRENGKSPMCSAYKEIIPQIFELYEQEKVINNTLP